MKQEKDSSSTNCTSDEKQLYLTMIFTIFFYIIFDEKNIT